jgi:parallel beta-helix repeat protein
MRQVRLLWRLLLIAALVAMSTTEAFALRIETDTVWQGQLQFEDDVVVAPEATLLVEPGTVVSFVSRKNRPLSLVVQGKLVAQGTESEPVVFTSAARNRQPGDWQGIVLNGTGEHTSRIRYAHISFARHGIQGARARLVLEDSVLERNETGLTLLKAFVGGAYACRFTANTVACVWNQNSDFSLTHCLVKDNLKEGLRCNLNSAPEIIHNIIQQNGEAGIVCFQGATPLIRDNLVEGHGKGILVEMKSHPEIRWNDLTGNDTAIWVEKLVSPKITGNRIVDNGVGVYCNYSGYPFLRGNHILDNRRFAIVLGDNQSRKVETLLPAGNRQQLLEAETESGAASPYVAEGFDTGSEDILFDKVDARRNWWGKKASDEMAAGNSDISIFEDFFDKPQTFYQKKPFPRDQVAYSPWLTAPRENAGKRSGQSGGLRGKVTLDGKPLAGARVHVFRGAENGFHGEGFSYSAPTDDAGCFSLNLAPGRYDLVARRTSARFPDRMPSPGDFQGYFGGNPLQVPDGGTLELTLPVSPVKPWHKDRKDDNGTALVEGTVSAAGNPLEGAMIYFYPKSAKELRGPDLFGPRGAVPAGTASDGSFSVELPPGSYFLLAAKRAEDRLGPLKAGDYFGYFAGNPLLLKGGDSLRVALSMVEKARDSRPWPQPNSDRSGIQGILQAAEGEIPAGLYAFAFTEPYPEGALPPFRSQPLDDSGRFFIPVDSPGVYYVGARTGHGGPPRPGEWHSYHGDNQLLRVQVSEDGRSPGLKVMVWKME